VSELAEDTAQGTNEVYECSRNQNNITTT
jgi:hypothetical protein